MIALAGWQLEAARAGLAAAHLDDARQVVMGRDTPVEAVAAEIHQPPAAGEIGVERIQHARRMILRMAPGDDAAVIIEESKAFLVDPIVGDDVELLLDRMQPI